MKNFYSNYNEEDLLVAYLYMVDHTGKINDEMYEVICKKFNYDEFVQKAEYRKILIKEKGRISFDVHNSVQKGDKIDLILKNISSEVIESDDLKIFIVEEFEKFVKVKENDKIDKDVIYKSLLGIVVGTMAGFLFLKTVIAFTHSFSFFLLGPVYIINYFVIYGFTRKTRDNLIVFLAVFISVIISTILTFIQII
ncbi:hypothetical protein [Chryseobacterium jejuense]|uniref:Uncharacterized protein n=1 Tax=Chryseobacterium jejuense TaxID=445960 RepID=A0A2X2WRE8_CHRJE|nr:hypothetical protein [Chryseobacterium jejuense]SDJ36811.1 hypothetical protein SAMN05421542_3329 [Chryseobacterium jejuense]SQB45832.1 Uncharacterised protein [Chryseobacterium jejuense]